MSAGTRPLASPLPYRDAPAPLVTPRAARAGGTAGRVLPTLLVGGCLAVAAGVIWAAPALGAAPAALDAELARLLRAMAVIKGVLAALGVGALAWRVRRPVSPLLGAAYVAGAWVAAGATAAMWSLVALGAVAVVLHGAGALLLLLAWRDADFIPAAPAPGRRAGTR
jgi:hypothetical protein